MQTCNYLKLATIILTLALTSCSGKNGSIGLQGPSGDPGIQGERGPKGEDGKDATLPAFSETGILGIYKESSAYNGSSTTQLTCMLGESIAANKVVLRIRSATGGMLELKKAGGNRDLIYIPANIELLVTTTSGNGTYTATIDNVQQTKACSPL